MGGELIGDIAVDLERVVGGLKVGASAGGLELLSAGTGGGEESGEVELVDSGLSWTKGETEAAVWGFFWQHRNRSAAEGKRFISWIKHCSAI